MSSVTRLPALALGLAFFLAGAARADEMHIKARIVHLRSQPSSEAKIKVKLGGGRSVSVLGQSEDGQWVHVKGELEKGPDMIPFDGWLAVAEVRGEKVLGTEGTAKPSFTEDQAPAPAGKDGGWGDEGGSSSSPPAPTTASASDSGWFDDSKTPAGGTVGGSGGSTDDPWAAPASKSDSADKSSGSSDGW